MKRIDHATATEDDEFTEGNPGTGTPATRVTAQWLNVLQEEIAHVVEEAGLTLDQTGVNRHQLMAALEALFDDTTLTFATDAEYLAAIVNNKPISPSNLASYQSIGTNGYKRLGGGLIIEWGSFTIPASTLTFDVTLPLTLPNQYLAAVCTLKNYGSAPNSVDLASIGQTSLSQFKFWPNGSQPGYARDYSYIIIGR